MYYNIHTHHISYNDDVRSLVNLKEPDPSLVGNTTGLYYSAGIHPCGIDHQMLEDKMSFLRQLSRHPSVIAIGECGLDKVCNTPMEWQKNAFESQITISEEAGKPLIIHCVKTIDEVLYYKRKINPAQAWVIHGFRGKRKEAESLIKKGFYLSIGPLHNEDTLRAIPLDRLFLETDDSNSCIQDVYSKTSATLELAEPELIKQIEANVTTLFYSLKKIIL